MADLLELKMQLDALRSSRPKSPTEHRELVKEITAMDAMISLIESDQTALLRD